MTDRLQGRYRRLVALYPAGHRAAYAEDMINVLMDDAQPGQQRPQLSVRLDLLKGAAAAWAFRVRTTARTWQQMDAASAVALLALLALCTTSFAAAGQVLDATSNSSYGRWGELGTWLPRLVWIPVATAAALGLRRVAAWTAGTLGVLLPMFGSAAMSAGWTPGYLGSLNSPAWVALSLIATAGLFADRGLRPGIDRLGRSVTASAVLMGVVAMSLPGNAPEESGWTDPVRVPLLGIGVTLFLLACVQAALKGIRRRVLTTAAALALTVYLTLAYSFARIDGGTVFDDMIEQLDIILPITLLLCALTVLRLTVVDPDGHRQLSGTT